MKKTATAILILASFSCKKIIENKPQQQQVCYICKVHPYVSADSVEICGVDTNEAINKFKMLHNGVGTVVYDKPFRIFVSNTDFSNQCRKK